MTSPQDTPTSHVPRMIVRENGVERTEHLTQDEVSVGRSKENEIEIDDISMGSLRPPVMRSPTRSSSGANIFR